MPQFPQPLTNAGKATKLHHQDHLPQHNLATIGVEIEADQLVVPEGPLLGEDPNEDIQVGGRLASFQHRWAFSSWTKSIVSCGLG